MAEAQGGSCYSPKRTLLPICCWKAENVKVSFRKWIMQQTNRSTKQWIKQKKSNVLERYSQSLDINPTEMLWKDLRQAVPANKSANMSEFKLFCEKEWAKIPSS